MFNDRITEAFQDVENRYLLIIAASRRSRQLLDRAEKHGMSADTEKVILQSLEEIVNSKVTYDIPTPAEVKKKTKE